MKTRLLPATHKLRVWPLAGRRRKTWIFLLEYFVLTLFLAVMNIPNFAYFIPGSHALERLFSLFFIIPVTIALQFLSTFSRVFIPHWFRQIFDYPVQVWIVLNILIGISILYPISPNLFFLHYSSFRHVNSLRSLRITLFFMCLLRNAPTHLVTLIDLLFFRFSTINLFVLAASYDRSNWLSFYHTQL